MSNTIYCISNKINDKVYIGQTIDFERRKRDHFTKYKTLNYKIYCAMRKHGVENFSIEPIFSVFDKSDIGNIETIFISEYNSYNNGYNSSIGGFGQKEFTHSKETISNMKGENNSNFKGYWHTPFGKLSSYRDVGKYTNLIAVETVYRWCKNPDIKIRRKSRYLSDNMIGKTYREIGFWFEPK